MCAQRERGQPLKTLFSDSGDLKIDQNLNFGKITTKQLPSLPYFDKRMLKKQNK